jgi:hypothetical protein
MMKNRKIHVFCEKKSKSPLLVPGVGYFATYTKHRLCKYYVNLLSHLIYRLLGVDATLVRDLMYS